MSKKILVIDSDNKTGRGLCQFLSGKGLQTLAVTNGVDAAKVMSHELPDMTIVDQNVSMTGIKTAQIMRIKPESLKMPILLGIKPGESGETRETLKLAIQSGVSWVVPRPYRSDNILTKIQEHLEKSSRVPERQLSPEELSNHIRKKIRSLTDLPVLSPAQQRLLTILAADDEEVDVDKLIEAIQSDQALTMRTLRIARSAIYGFQGNQLSTAVTFLGIKKMRQIVQSATLLNIFDQHQDDDGMNYKDFWEHSLACGMVMQMISRDNHASKHFMSGLLHDVGKLVLGHSFPPYAKAIDATVRRTEQPCHVVEKQLLGISHMEIGQEIALSWNLPNEITESIVNHHNPSSAVRHKMLTSLVYTADVAVRKMGIGHDGDCDTAELEDEFAKKLKLPLAFSDLLEKKDVLIEQIQAIVNS